MRDLQVNAIFPVKQLQNNVANLALPYPLVRTDAKISAIANPVGVPIVAGLAPLRDPGSFNGVPPAYTTARPAEANPAAALALRVAQRV